MQLASTPVIMDAIINKLEAEDYDTKTFNMNVTFARAVAIHLGRELVKDEMDDGLRWM